MRKPSNEEPDLHQEGRAEEEEQKDAHPDGPEARVADGEGGMDQKDGDQQDEGQVEARHEDVEDVAVGAEMAAARQVVGKDDEGADEDREQAHSDYVGDAIDRPLLPLDGS